MYARTTDLNWQRLGCLSVLAARLGQAVLVMLAVTAVAFLMFRYVGDPVAIMAREGATQEEKQELRRSLGLDRPILVQYGQFLGRIATRQSRHRATATSGPWLNCSRSGCPRPWNSSWSRRCCRWSSAFRSGSSAPSDRTASPPGSSRRSSLIGISTPTFVTGIVLILVFAVALGWLPSFGRGDVVRTRLVDHGLPDGQRVSSR